jgi:hypothetical protein
MQRMSKPSVMATVKQTFKGSFLIQLSDGSDSAEIALTIGSGSAETLEDLPAAIAACVKKNLDYLAGNKKIVELTAKLEKAEAAHAVAKARAAALEAGATEKLAVLKHIEEIKASKTSKK